MQQMDEGRKCVIGVMAAILTSLHMRTADDLFGGPEGSPRTDGLISASIQWAEKLWKRLTNDFRHRAGRKPRIRTVLPARRRLPTHRLPHGTLKNDTLQLEHFSIARLRNLFVTFWVRFFQPAVEYFFIFRIRTFRDRSFPTSTLPSFTTGGVGFFD
jgi:hypothetical protein